MIQVLPQKAKLLNPYGNVEATTAAADSSDHGGISGIDFMSPLPPQMKGTFVDKLPSWNNEETSNPVNVLNVNFNTGKKFTSF